MDQKDKIFSVQDNAIIYQLYNDSHVMKMKVH
jgi:hypothetical protein